MWVFVHGWGFDANFWTPLLDAMALEHPTRCLDLGFRGDEDVALPETPLIAVGHSLGFLWLNQYLRQPVTAQIAINGFTRFCAAPDWPAGVNPRELRLMQRQLTRNPVQCWQDFFHRCGGNEALISSQGAAAAPSNALRPERAEAGLLQLADGDVRQSLPSCRRLALVGDKDAVVSPALSDASFGGQTQCTVRRHPNGDHLLPLSATTWCAQQIHAFLEDLTA